MSDVHIPISQVTRVSKGVSAARPKFWRSLDELTDSEDIKVWLHREFPEKASEFTDPEGRRQFLQLMGASVALAGLSSACTRQPAEAIVPYVKAPEQFIPGKPVYFATVLATDGAAQGVLVESHMGRPTKIEGNPDHPGSLGSTDHFAQAEILNLYDPDRSKSVLYRTETSTWAAFVAAISPVLEAQKALKGEGLRLLTTTVTSPTLAAQIAELLKQFPMAKWHVHDAISRRNAMDGARAAFGRPLQPIYNFAEADVIVSLDADFLGTGGDKVANARAFVARRASDETAREMNRLYMAESSVSVTGGNADHRVAVRAAEVEGIAGLRVGEQGHGLGLELVERPELAFLVKGALQFVEVAAQGKPITETTRLGGIGEADVRHLEIGAIRIVAHGEGRVGVAEVSGTIILKRRIHPDVVRQWIVAFFSLPAQVMGHRHPVGEARLGLVALVGVTREHLHGAGGMPARLLVHGTQDRELVGDLRIHREQLGQLHARHVRGDGLERTAVLAADVGLGIVGIDVGLATREPDHDDRLALGLWQGGVGGAQLEQ